MCWLVEINIFLSESPSSLWQQLPAQSSFAALAMTVSEWLFRYQLLNRLFPVNIPLLSRESWVTAEISRMPLFVLVLKVSCTA